MLKGCGETPKGLKKSEPSNSEKKFDVKYISSFFSFYIIIPQSQFPQIIYPPKTPFAFDSPSFIVASCVLLHSALVSHRIVSIWDETKESYSITLSLIGETKQAHWRDKG